MNHTENCFDVVQRHMQNIVLCFKKKQIGRFSLNMSNWFCVLLKGRPQQAILNTWSAGGEMVNQPDGDPESTTSTTFSWTRCVLTLSSRKSIAPKSVTVRILLGDMWRWTIGAHRLLGHFCNPKHVYCCLVNKQQTICWIWPFSTVFANWIATLLPNELVLLDDVLSNFVAQLFVHDWSVHNQ